MAQPFRILLVEDNQDDVELLRIQLKKLDLEFHLDVVDKKSRFIEHLEYQLPDVIICDYNLPGFTGMEALEFIRKRSSDIPFILVSGYIGEEKAVDAMLQGASDYVLKDNLERLGPAVKREIIHFREQKKTEKERDKAIRDLKERVKEQKCLYNISSLDDHSLSISELLQKAVLNLPEGFQYPELAAASIEYNGKTYQTDNFVKNGQSISASIDDLDNGPLVVSVSYTMSGPELQKTPFLEEERYLLTSITKNLSLKINRIQNQKELQKSEQRFKSLVQDGSDLISIIDSEGYYKYVSPTSQRVESMGMEQDDFIGLRCYDFIHQEDRERVRKTISDLKPGERGEIERYRFKNSRGEWRWLESAITNLTETPAVDGYVANSRDVTDRVEQERKLQDIVENSTNLFYRHDADNVITYISPQSVEFLGCSPEEAKRRWTEFVTDHPVNKEGFQKTLKAIERGIAQEPYELQLEKTTGEKIWVEVNEGPVIENGKTVAMVGSLTDITARKEYEEKLEELSLVASKTTDVIIMTDENERITWVNKAYEDLTGYSIKESLGRIPGDFLQGPETDPETVKRLAIAVDARKTIDEVILNYAKDGTKYWLDMKIDPIFDDGTCTGFIAIERDVTEMIEQKRKLQESVERYDIVTKATSDTIWDEDLVNSIVTYNSNIYDVFGYKPGDVENTGDWWLSKVHPDDRERVDKKFKMAEISDKDLVHVEYRFQCADGSYRYIDDRAYIINDETGKPTRMIGAMQDITKQKEENRWLKVLESAITNTNESIAILNVKTDDTPYREILYVNDAFEKMTGYRREEVLGYSLLKLMGKGINQRAVANVLQSLDKGEACQIESAYQSKKGEEYWAHLSFAPVRDVNGEYTHWICIGRDVTERRKRISQLRESLQEKETMLMEIHHRVKNNLAVVSSMMQLQAMDEHDEELKRKLYDSVSRIRTMVTIHEMLYESGSFSKINFSINIQKLVSMIIETIQNQLDIDVLYDCDEVELNVNQAIPSSLIVNEIITNCIKHAFKGRERGQIKIELQELDSEVTIKIKDDGVGLPDDFEEKGTTSLGLQLIHVLSKQMNASYQYKYLNDNGTEFSMQFEKTNIKGIGSAYLI